MKHTITPVSIRHFIKYACACATCACACAMMLTGCAPKAPVITILHTNDTHSQVEPTNPKAEKNADLGGYARRMGLIAMERAVDPELLLLDAGDFSQGSPFFNYFRGRVEVEALNRMGYDAVTFGNHEFDNGLDTLAMLLRLAKFPLVCANYDCTGTPLEGLVKPYIVLKRGGHKIGIIGVGVSPDDLIAKDNFGGIRYLDPLPVINETADMLRNKKHCELIIVLSHLGTDNSNGVSDLVLAKQMHNVDIIIGGHTHHIFNGERVLDADNHEVVLSQMGKGGMRVGKIKVKFDEE